MFEYEAKGFPGRKAILVQDLSELPHFKGAKKVYLDIETTSGDDNKKSLSPWVDCDILGFCITVDNYPDAYYIPLRHRWEGVNRYCNLPIEPVYAWIKDIVDNCEEWINHNIKYDAHVLHNHAGIYPRCKLVDTLSLSKLYRGDHFRYNLTYVCSEFMHLDISAYESKLKNSLGRIMDYAWVPVDVMAEYGAVDALAVRQLYEFLMKNIHPDCRRVVDIETDLTPILFDMEITGMKLDNTLIFQEYKMLPILLSKLKQQVIKGTGIKKFRPQVNADCEDLLCGTYKLPVIERTEKAKNPSFSAHALEGYMNMPQANKEIIYYLAQWKKYYKLFTSFTKPYFFGAHKGGWLHPDYNQIVSTGRMSCRNPNAQQLSPLAKRYIAAPEGMAIVDVDFSQIEFRVIVHYANDTRCIKAYNEDPNTDFHKWVQTMCHLERPAAKTLNFRLGYGGGKSTTALALTTTEGFIQDGESIEEAIFRGERIYERYYENLPTLKKTRWRASDVLKARGYTRTILGRHRHLPEQAAFKAFNSVCQGTAADLMKDATIRLKPYLDSEPDVNLFGIVHDSWCLYAPKERAEEVAQEVIRIVEQLPEDVNFRVPIKADRKISETNWSECD